MELVNLLIEAGIPDGVVNLINGDPAGMGQEMLDNPLCAKIHFTGSQRVGRLLMDGASKTITRLSLELGGNAPVLIFPDVDLDQVAAGAVTAKLRNAGQVCVSPQRFFAHRSIAAGFAERVVALAADLRLGNGLDDSTTIDPLINARQRDHIKPKLARAGLAWANFQAMRRTHSTLMGDLGIDGKLVAGQCGHTLDVSQNVYRQSPVASRLPAVNELEKKLLICDRSTDRAGI